MSQLITELTKYIQVNLVTPEFAAGDIDSLLILPDMSYKARS